MSATSPRQTPQPQRPQPGGREDGRCTGHKHRRHFGGDRAGAQLGDERRWNSSTLGLEARPQQGHPRRLRALQLITYFTAGPKETRAWTGTRALAPQVAGVIHTDFERGFIRAQTIACNDFVTLGGEVAPRKLARPATKARSTSSRTATSCCSSSTPDLDFSALAIRSVPCRLRLGR